MIDTRTPPPSYLIWIMLPEFGRQAGLLGGFRLTDAGFDWSFVETAEVDNPNKQLDFFNACHSSIPSRNKHHALWRRSLNTRAVASSPALQKIICKKFAYLQDEGPTYKPAAIRKQIEKAVRMLYSRKCHLIVAGSGLINAAPFGKSETINMSPIEIAGPVQRC